MRGFKPDEDNDKRHVGNKEFDSLLSEALLGQQDHHRKIGRVQSSPSRYRKGTALLILVLASGLVVFSYSHLVPLFFTISGRFSCGAATSNNVGSTGVRSIGLIDQLGTEYPSPAFVENISETAKRAGYVFEYYPNASSSLNFFVNLPSYGYTILILRTHGTGLLATDPAAIVTSSQYSQSERTADQLAGNVVAVAINGTKYFGLTPDFITNDMCGRFSSTIVLTMYCSGAYYAEMAKAFLEKGASDYVGWNSVVTVSHSDLVFESLFMTLVEGKTVDWAVQNTMTTLRQDQYGARLVDYSPASLHVTLPWWDHYWYIVSVVTLVGIVGLRRMMNASARRAKMILSP